MSGVALLMRQGGSDRLSRSRELQSPKKKLGLALWFFKITKVLMTGAYVPKYRLSFF
jgi:hypothetical protein